MKTHRILFGGGLLAAVSLHAQPLSWTQCNTGVAAGLHYTAAAYGNGRYAVTAFGRGTAAGTIQSQVAFSADGLAWSVVTLPTAPKVRGIAHGNGLWVVPVERIGIDPGNTQNILTSVDGVAWTPRTTGAGSLRKVAHTTAGTRNLFVAVGLAEFGFNTVFSLDATTWTRISVGGATADLDHLAAGNGIVVAAGDTVGSVHATTDGSTWTTVTIPGILAQSPRKVEGLTFAGGEFILATSTFASNAARRLYTSPNGTTWTPGPIVTGPPDNFTASAVGASGSVTAGTSRVILAGGTVPRGLQIFSIFVTDAGPPGIIVTATGNLATWTSQSFGTRDLFNWADHNFAFFANNRWLVGNDNTELFTAPDTAGGEVGGGERGPTSPTITVQPIDRYADIGGSVTFSITATGTGLAYQWLLNGAAIPGATAPSYTLTNVTATDIGFYSVRVSNAGGTTTSNVAMLYGPTGSAYFSNLSVRGRAGVDSATLTVGATLSYNFDEDRVKSVLVRGIGPTLATFGVAGVLTDPVLSFFGALNDDWGSQSDGSLPAINAASAAVGAFALPAGSRDSALLMDLKVGGGYTLQLTGKTGETGTAQIELYDLDAPDAFFRFTNLSARTFAGTGDNTLIVGFNLAGTHASRIVIRAVGPGLAPFGITGTMPDPKLELYRGQIKIGENDNWEAPTLLLQESLAMFPLAFPSRDAVLVAVLDPGAYTVQVTGGTAGIVLVELYAAP